MQRRALAERDQRAAALPGHRIRDNLVVQMVINLRVPMNCHRSENPGEDADRYGGHEQDTTDSPPGGVSTRPAGRRGGDGAGPVDEGRDLIYKPGPVIA